ncbi:Tripartite-type tricarboxylate transporter, receptor component TctC [Cohaesibacter marisflavi]|uniref:Tripartite-type tricarboxylate transporter, receptor component TctC n=1 Tax=Cohaesibacter marisflavi TaxID=655353 RepID=A0A1I5JS03_9HYPH|nr:tripartite tricarboxylate transporter substrate binding protein [Cohaesibacter marisflavi]SFO75624.1 Tripartite-type tricarboxylate transporter, receptor component TctC [Cohaesibacter marisflavi]
MKITRRFGLALAAGMLLTPFVAQAADNYPDHAVKIIIPYGAGGTTDTSARQLASQTEKLLGQPIVVENMPGGSGANAMRAVAAADADGYTLIAATSSPSFVTPALRPVGYDPLKDFEPVLNYSGPYHGVLVKADSPYKTFEDMIEAAKSGTSLSFGTAGALGGAHLAFTSVAKQSGGALQHVPFNGASAATAAVLGGHVDISLVPAYRDLVQDGQLRLLGVLDGSRDPEFPDSPTLNDLGYKAEFPSIVGILAPAGTDPAIISKLETAFTKAASSDEFKKFMTKLGQPVRIMSGEALKKTISENFYAYQEIAKEISK